MANNQQQKLPPGINIKTNYIPKAKLNVRKAKRQTQICPKCENPIPINEISEHMRIELLDPKWREQKAKNVANNSHTNYIQTNEIAENLKHLASFRTDIFGGDEKQAIKKLKETREKAKQKEKNIWDGHANSVQTVTSKAAASMSIEDYMRYMQAVAKSKDAIGPQANKPNASVPLTQYYAGRPPAASYYPPPHGHFIPAPPPPILAPKPPTDFDSVDSNNERPFKKPRT